MEEKKKSQRGGWSQDEGTGAAEDARMSGTGEEVRTRTGCSSLSAEVSAEEKMSSRAEGTCYREVGTGIGQSQIKTKYSSQLVWLSG